MQATKLLEAQHRTAETLFERILRAPGTDTRCLIEELAQHLLATMIIEQTIFYPAVIELNEHLVLEGYEEHSLARFQLRRILGSTVEHGARFEAKVRILEELIRHHMRGEERHLFPSLHELPEEADADLARRMKQSFDDLVRRELDVLLLRSRRTSEAELAAGAAAA